LRVPSSANEDSLWIWRWSSCFSARAIPLERYASFNAASPPDFAYTSVLDVLRPLAKAGMPVESALNGAVLQMEARLAKLKTGSGMNVRT